jgi:CBS domain-containing protein
MCCRWLGSLTAETDMLVTHILDLARSRLIVAGAKASIAEAAQLMQRPSADLIVVCESARALGVITKSDVLRPVAIRRIDPEMGLTEIMSRHIISCRTTDRLLDVWSAMSDHGFSRLPVLDDDRSVLGVLYARDALQALLSDAEHEEAAMRAYVQGVGYH